MARRITRRRIAGHAPVAVKGTPVQAPNHAPRLRDDYVNMKPPARKL
jgi:hypothetical protein